MITSLRLKSFRRYVDERLTFEGGMLELCRVTAFALTELGHLHLQLAPHLRGPLGELLQQLRRDAGDLRLTIDDLGERDAVTVSELSTQHRLIQTTKRPLMLLQDAGI